MKKTLLTISLLLPSLALSDSVESFCADLVRNHNGLGYCSKEKKAMEVAFDIGLNKIYKRCFESQKYFSKHYLGIKPKSRPRIEKQFHKCVEVRKRDNLVEQEDKDFLKFLDRY